MLSLIHFILREYLSGTHMIAELIVALIGLALVAEQTAEEARTSISILAIFISCICFSRIYTRWKGATRDLYLLALGKPRFVLSIILSALIIAGTTIAILFVYTSTYTVKYSASTITQAIMQTLAMISFSYLVSNFFKNATSFPAAASIMLGITGFFAFLLPEPLDFIAFIVPATPEREPWLSVLITTTYTVLALKLSYIFEQK